MREQRPVDKLQPGMRIWLSLEGEGVFGHGKWMLLDAIHREGSLRAAADSLGISYRKAWGDLRKAEKALGISLLERHRGGAAGGECTLTAQGLLWHKEYIRFHKDVEKCLRRSFLQWCARMQQ